MLHRNWICISSRLRDIETETYWGHNTLRHWSRDDLIPHMLFPIGAPLKPSPYLQALEIYSTPTISGSRPWPFGVTWRHRACDHLIPPYSISYRCSIVTDSISSRFRDIGPWTYWGHDLDLSVEEIDYPILHMQFPISAPLEPSPYLQAFSRYLAPNISGLRHWPFVVTWRHWSCDHLMPHVAFPIGVPL